MGKTEKKSINICRWYCHKHRKVIRKKLLILSREFISIAKSKIKDFKMLNMSTASKIKAEFCDQHFFLKFNFSIY